MYLYRRLRSYFPTQVYAFISSREVEIEIEIEIISSRDRDRDLYRSSLKLQFFHVAYIT
jgi:hypothetical protein